MIKLVRPSQEYEKSCAEARQEFIEETGCEPMFAKQMNGESFAAYVQRLQGYAKGIDLPDGYVPESFFWLVDGKNYVGEISIRHRLTDNLLKVGGHIGYWLRPAMRGKGYASKMLGLALPEARKLGIDKVLVTCAETNIASRRVIEKNGGVLENILREEGEPGRMRFWISLGK